MNRATVTALVLGVHALFVLLILAGNHMRLRQPEMPQQLQGIWIRLNPVAAPAVRTRPEDDSTPPPATAPTQNQETPAPLPRTAITLPPSPQPSTDRPVEKSTESRPVDWHSEAARIAAEITAEKPTSIGKPLQPQREPCKPRVSSLWGKPKEPRPAGPGTWQDLVEPAAEVVTGATRHTIQGGFSIPLGKSKPRDDLFDDMLAGATPRSSVPDPHICD
jgi:hypothetical protein